MKIGTYNVLSKSPVFKGIPPLKIEEHLKQIPHRLVKYNKTQCIALRGDKCERLILLLKGKARAEMVDFNGKAVEVETISAPRPLAPAFVFGKNNSYPVDIIAVEEIIALSLPKSSLISLIRLDTTLLKNYLDLLSNRAYFLSERLNFMSFKTIKAKFANYVCNFLAPGENRVMLPKNQQELSEFFGVSRPSLGRVIGELEKEGIISHNRKEIVIKDMETLKGFL
ncbi:MAG: Crp/Fnr family transcriptional regulator [bacterium]|nr:Crp/Fnr family transcriptional regulator [bacterium]